MGRAREDLATNVAVDRLVILGMHAAIFSALVSVVLILVGIVGLLLGNRLFLGILDVDLTKDVVYLLTDAT